VVAERSLAGFRLWSYFFMPIKIDKRAGRGLQALLALSALVCAPAAGWAVSCTTQAGLAAADRNALALAGQRLSTAVVESDAAGLQASLLPSVAGQWDGIREAAEIGGAFVKGGQARLRNLYLLDATSLTAPTDAQFFCSGANGATVTISMRSLPPGKYALVLADAAGAPMAGQIGLVLGWDANAWKLGGLFVRPGQLDGHDGVYYWQRAREAARSGAPWASYYAYEAARTLLLPVDFLSSPNLDKLNTEQGQITGAPAFPYNVQAGDRTFKIDSVHFDTGAREADLGVVYESTGVTDPAALRTEATTVLSAFLKAQPVLRGSFHGIWAYSSNGGKITPIMELPMNRIP
jgi:hypothetical protein